MSAEKKIFGRTPWIVMKAGKNILAMDSIHVREMVQVPLIVPVPRMPAEYAGIINLRGSIIPLIDTRILLGDRSAREELRELKEIFTQRKQDHRNWIAKLRQAVEEDKEFTGEQNPHKCAFGRWYDAYSTEHHILSAILRRFDEPHKQIHGTAAVVNECLRNGSKEEARQAVDRVLAGAFPRMLKIFEEAREALEESNREIAVVLSCNGCSKAITVDSVMAVENFKEETFKPKDSQQEASAASYLLGMARRPKDDSVVMIVDAAVLIGGPGRTQSGPN
jgi:chemotaxis signal transduction protein